MMLLSDHVSMCVHTNSHTIMYLIREEENEFIALLPNGKLLYVLKTNFCVVPWPWAGYLVYLSFSLLIFENKICVYGFVCVCVCVCVYVCE